VLTLSLSEFYFCHHLISYPLGNARDGVSEAMHASA
jgi:hypothetical protein